MASMETDLNVRMAERRDIDCMASMAAALRDELGQREPSEAEFHERIGGLIDDPDTDYLLATGSGGACLGFVQQRYRRSIWSAGEEANLEELFVVAGSRRLGLGARLVKMAVERALSRGCEAVMLDTNERNLGAIAFYKRLGFRFSFTHTTTEITGGREVLLEKPLRAPS
jgi:ribosomal protein S18 acetylase RimI-like enzyme